MDAVCHLADEAGLEPHDVLTEADEVIAPPPLLCPPLLCPSRVHARRPNKR